MAKYKFYISDSFTKVPLICGYVRAFSKFHAKIKVKKEILTGKTGYIITASKLKRG